MSDEVFKLKVGKEAYLELIKAVREFDIEAASILDSEVRYLHSFAHCNDLGGVFTWVDSKQGSEYWINIQDKLREVRYYG